MQIGTAGFLDFVYRLIFWKEGILENVSFSVHRRNSGKEIFTFGNTAFSSEFQAMNKVQKFSSNKWSQFAYITRFRLVYLVADWLYLLHLLCRHCASVKHNFSYKYSITACARASRWEQADTVLALSPLLRTCYHEVGNDGVLIQWVISQLCVHERTDESFVLHTWSLKYNVCRQ